MVPLPMLILHDMLAGVYAVGYFNSNTEPQCTTISLHLTALNGKICRVVDDQSIGDLETRERVYAAIDGILNKALPGDVLALVPTQMDAIDEGSYMNTDLNATSYVERTLATSISTKLDDLFKAARTKIIEHHAMSA